MKELQQIKNRYDPNNDQAPEGPAVTWADYQLTLAIEALSRQIAEKRKTKYTRQKLGKILQEIVNALMADHIINRSDVEIEIIYDIAQIVKKISDEQ